MLTPLEIKHIKGEKLPGPRISSDHSDQRKPGKSRANRSFQKVLYLCPQDISALNQETIPQTSDHQLVARGLNPAQHTTQSGP